MKSARGSAGYLPQMSAAEFAAALKTHGFRVVRAKIEDATGQCSGIRWSAVLRGAAVDRNRTLAKILRERDAEVARRHREPSWRGRQYRNRDRRASAPRRLHASRRHFGECD
jgi:hypothetical protein